MADYYVKLDDLWDLESDCVRVLLYICKMVNYQNKNKDGFENITIFLHECADFINAKSNHKHEDIPCMDNLDATDVAVYLGYLENYGIIKINEGYCSDDLNYIDDATYILSLNKNTLIRKSAPRSKKKGQ